MRCCCLLAGEGAFTGEVSAGQIADCGLKRLGAEISQVVCEVRACGPFRAPVPLWRDR